MRKNLKEARQKAGMTRRPIMRLFLIVMLISWWISIMFEGENYLLVVIMILFWLKISKKC